MFLSDEGFVLVKKLVRKSKQIDLDRDPDFHQILIDALTFEGVIFILVEALPYPV